MPGAPSDALLKSASTSLSSLSSKRSSRKVVFMSNPYVSLPLLDVVHPDDSIRDYAYFSEKKLVLVILLSSSGDILAYYQTYGESPKTVTLNFNSVCTCDSDPVVISLSTDSNSVVFGLMNGDVLVVPTQMLVGTGWPVIGHLSPQRQSPILIKTNEEDAIMNIPTSITCFSTMFSSRPTIIMSNKGGSIRIIDLDSRKWVAELTAPESIHRLDVLSDSEKISTDLLVTSFTGAQWVIPLENGGRGYTEVLSTCIPSEFRQIDPPSTQLFPHPKGVCVLDGDKNTIELHTSIDTTSARCQQKFKVPSDTWLAYISEFVSLTVSGNNELRSVLHFGMNTQRLEYTLVKDLPEWRIVGIVDLPRRDGCIDEYMVINERGLVRLSQDPQTSIDELACEYLFRLPIFTLSALHYVSLACQYSSNEKLQSILIPRVLNKRKSKRLSQTEISSLLFIAKALQIPMDELLDIFTSTQHEDHLLQEALRVVEKEKNSSLLMKIPELFGKKVERNSFRDNFKQYRQKKDGELSVFLSSHVEVTGDVCPLLVNRLWRSSCLLGMRDTKAAAEVLKFIAKEGTKLWTEEDRNDRAQMFACLFNLDWNLVTHAEMKSLAQLVIEFHPQMDSPSQFENCIKVAVAYREKFPEICDVIYLLSAMYLLSENESVLSTKCRVQNICSGSNNSAAISSDDRLITWGELTNQQKKQIDPKEIAFQRQNGSRLGSQGSTEAKVNKLQLPQHVDIVGRIHTVASGAEHLLVLTTSAVLYSYGINSFGQCGVGHTDAVPLPQMITYGNWSPIIKLAVGQFHSAFLCDDGSLYTWGWGVYGQLGQGSRFISDVHYPRKVQDVPPNVIDVVCGRAHTLLLTADGDICMAGGGSYGQRGVNQDIRKTYMFTRLVIGEPGLKFTKIATKFYHSLALTECGRLFEWGRNPQEIKMKIFVMRRLKGAQRSNPDKPKGPSGLPQTIPRDDLGWREVFHLLDGNITELSTGLSHSALITDEGKLYTWGKGLDYQLGHGTKTERAEPHQVFDPQDVTWQHVDCGGYHTVASVSDGRVFSWGKNDFTQCGILTDKSRETPRRFYFQAKGDGSRRSVQLPDESLYVLKPSLIHTVQTKILNENVSPRLDNDEILRLVQEAKPVVLKEVSRQLQKAPSESPVSSSVPVALSHLLAGNLTTAIEQVGRAADANKNPESVQAIASLTWEIIANHEDTQSRTILQAAFRRLPMSQTQRNSSQLKNLWPNVWNEPGCQRDLTCDEKLNMLQNWVPVVKSVNSVEIPSSALRTSTARVRVWARCGHVEPAVMGVAKECSTCAEEWRQKVKTSLETST